MLRGRDSWMAAAAAAAAAAENLHRVGETGVSDSGSSSFSTSTDHHHHHQPPPLPYGIQPPAAAATNL